MPCLIRVKGGDGGHGALTALEYAMSSSSVAAGPLHRMENSSKGASDLDEPTMSSGISK